MNIDFIYAVWGETYSKFLIKFHFPSLLTQGNLPSWPHQFSTSIIIYTTSKDRVNIESSDVIEELNQWVNVSFREIQADWNASKYRTMDLIHQEAILEAQNKQKSIIFMSPDSIYSNQSLYYLAQEIESGAEAILILGLKVLFETIEPFLKKDAYGHLSLTSQEGVDLILENLSPFYQECFLDAEYFSITPPLIGYETTSNQVEFRSFHLHPLFIKNPAVIDLNSEVDGQTIDGDYLEGLKIHHQKLTIIKDDRILGFSVGFYEELHHRKTRLKTSEMYSKMLALDIFRKTRCSHIHQYFFQFPIRYQSARLRKVNKENLNYLKALLVFWQLEELFSRQSYQDILSLYLKELSLLQKCLITAPFNICFYFIARACYILKQSDELHQLFDWLRGQSVVLEVFKPQLPKSFDYSELYELKKRMFCLIIGCNFEDVKVKFLDEDKESYIYVKQDEFTSVRIWALTEFCQELAVLDFHPEYQDIVFYALSRGIHVSYFV